MAQLANPLLQIDSNRQRLPSLATAAIKDQRTGGNLRRHNRFVRTTADSLDRHADESVKDARHEQESVALLALLRTKPETLPGALSALRYVADWADHNDAGLFHNWNDLHRSAGVAFLPMIANVIEAAIDSR